MLTKNREERIFKITYETMTVIQTVWVQTVWVKAFSEVKALKTARKILQEKHWGSDYDEFLDRPQYKLTLQYVRGYSGALGVVEHHAK